MANLQTYLTQEQQRLQAKRSKLTEERQRIDEQITAIDREIAAIVEYDRIRSGQKPTVAKSRKGRRTGRRDEILRLLTTSGNGLTRRQILEQLRVKGDRRAEQSVTNALSALKRSGRVGLHQGIYAVTQ